MLEKGEKITFYHSFASLQCFIFLISVKGVMISIIFDSILKFSDLPGIEIVPDRSDPDRHALDADPDPTKLIGSDPIRILKNAKAT
jgi:hypothetical protein